MTTRSPIRYFLVGIRLLCASAFLMAAGCVPTGAESPQTPVAEALATFARDLLLSALAAWLL